MRVLCIDIETSPNLAYVWGLWDQNVGLHQLVETTDVLCFAAKWLGERKIHYYSVQKDKQEMLEQAHALLDQADVVLHYNGRRFDIPHLNRELITAGFTPPSPYVQIDLLAVVRRQFKFPSNKLEYVSKALGLEGKVKHEGFDMWVKCMAGDKAAWRLMEKYNRQDVQLLEDLYNVVQPWIPGHPSRNLYDGNSKCPTCGSGPMQRRGYSYTKVSRYQRWQCQACGAWTRSTHREDAVDMVAV